MGLTIMMPTNVPIRLKFTLGGFNAACHEVEWKKGQLWYRHAVGAYLWEPPVLILPTEAEWARFWRGLETAAVWTWQPRYEDPDILDGAQWSLHVEYAGRRLKSIGSNAYPGD